MSVSHFEVVRRTNQSSFPGILLATTTSTSASIVIIGLFSSYYINKIPDNNNHVDVLFRLLPLLVLHRIYCCCYHYYLKRYNYYDTVCYTSVAVEVMPSLGIQIVQSTKYVQSASANIQSSCTIGSKPSFITCTDTQRTRCQFIPSELIYDVIILELVSFLKVHSCVYFRVLTTANSTIQDEQSDSITEKMKKGHIKLIPAFPGMSMTYSECEQMWQNIRTAMNSYSSTFNDGSKGEEKEGAT